MVHGGGHCSGGGGGFRGGGGFSGGTTYVSNTYFVGSRGRSRGWSGGTSRHSEDCDCSCCKVCCRALTCVSLKPKQRLKYLWFLVIVLSLIVGLSVGLGTYGTHKHETSSGDVIWLNTGLSPRFCSGVEVKSSDYPISLNVLPDKPIIKYGNYTTQKYDKFASLASQTYEYWGFYLLEGSKITVTGSSSDRYKNMDYYFVKGWHNLRKWEDDNFCCFEDHRSIGRRNSTFTHSIYGSDEYFVVFANRQSSFQQSITATITLQRTTYDLSGAIHKCINSKTCVVEYDGSDSSETVVITVPDINIQNVDVTTTCIRRDGVFVALFFIMPLGIGLSFSAIIYFACIRRRKSTSSYNVLQNPSDYSTFPQSTAASAPPMADNFPPPPAYPEPPSYEESTQDDKKHGM